MNILELSLYITNISYENNIWLNKVLNKNELHGLNYDFLNLKTVDFVYKNRNNIEIYINEKIDLVLPNICVTKLDNYLFISFCGIRNNKDLMCALDFLLKYDPVIDCSIHNGIYKSFYNIIDEVKLIIDIHKKLDYKIIITGHSFGASFAKLTCLYLSKVFEEEYMCIAFASPITGDNTFADQFNKYVSKSVNLCDPEDFIGNIPFTRYCAEKSKYMIQDKKLVPYKLCNRKYLLNLINYKYPTHKLSYFYEKIIIDDIDISCLKINEMLE